MSTAETMSYDLTGPWVGFGRTLRAAGVCATPDQVAVAMTAMAQLDVTRRSDVYWAGRLTLCGTREDLPRYDRAFAAYFGADMAGSRTRIPPVPRVRHVAVPGRAPEDDLAADEVAPPTASELEVLRSRDLAAMTPAERAEAARLVSLLRPVADPRRTRRRRPDARGRVDRARTVRAMLRTGGEPARLAYVRRAERPRRLVLLLDVSGSVQPYAEAYLRFAHAATRARPGTEVFTLGTRLTRVTRELGSREPEVALAQVSAAVPDWSGGTRLGEQLGAFLDRWGRRGVARGAVVVLASDGWERGDAAELHRHMERLARLAYRIVWVNPHRGRAGYEPLTAGMMAALPFVDDLVAGHSVESLARLARLVGGAVRA